MLKKLKKANHQERVLFDAEEGWNRVEKNAIVDSEKLRNTIEKTQLKLNESFFFPWMELLIRMVQVGLVGAFDRSDCV